VIPRLSAIFHAEPRLVNDFIATLHPEELSRFAKIFEGAVWSEEVEDQRERFLHYCRLHLSSSHYFKRFLQRVVARYPEYVEFLNRPDKLKVIATGIFARIDTIHSFAQKKEELGAYYDLEFLRVGLECMAGAPSSETNAEFTEFSDNYLQALFDVCRQEVREESDGGVRTRDLVALYSAGGHGRKLAFDDDYDLIILLNSDDPEIRAYCGKIITRMNREIIRRGTMPQYRFADHFGEYVTTFSEIKSLFSAPDEDVFIDMSQVMGARRIVGSRKFQEDLRREIIRPLILSRKEQFTRQVAAEIRSRHQAVEAGAISGMDVKETRGGLRDIELLLLILAAKSDIAHPVSQDLREPLVERYPERTQDLDRLFDAFGYLKRRRDIYRLTVAAEDEMLAGETGHMARVLGYCEDPEDEEGRQRLMDEFLATTREVAAIVESFLEELRL
jgi:UTP:GlnB (protein PII) uridylyltransferase